MAESTDALSEGWGQVLRLLPMLSILAFAVLAVSTGVAYERELRFLAYCNDGAIASGCLSRAQLLQNLGALWVIAAAAVGVLMVIERFLVGRSRGLDIPPQARLAYALFLIAFGVTGVFIASAQGYGRVPDGTAEAFLYTYLTSSLFLFAGTYLDPRPRSDVVSKAATVAGSAHGIVGTILALVYAYALAFPSVVSS